MLKAGLLALLLALVPGSARAQDPLEARPFDIAAQMAECSPVVGVDEGPDPGAASLRFLFAPWDRTDSTPEDLRERTARIVRSGASLADNEVAYSHVLYRVTLLLPHISLEWAQEQLPEALRASFEHGVIVACFQTVEPL